jgi:predicted dithiol-disulfide oxidoreductase (DUF899 family)
MQVMGAVNHQVVSESEWVEAHKARGPEWLLGAYSYLDLVPKGRDEANLPFPMAWVRHHDRYESQPKAAGSCCSAGSHS